MNSSEIRNLIEAGNLPWISTRISSVTELDGKLILNSFIALPITVTSKVYDDTQDIEIVSSDGIHLGMLCFRSNIAWEPDKLTDWQFVAYMTDTNIEKGFSCSCEFDYFVMDVRQYDEYINKYRDTAPLWGRYSHQLEVPSPYKVSVQEIIAKNIELPSKFHVENCLRAILEPYSFERYLKYYHLIELQFDQQLVFKIKALNDDLVGIGQLLKDYRRDDVERLKSLINPISCEDINEIVTRLNVVDKFLDKAEDIFFKFGKESNPIKEYASLLEITETADGFGNQEVVKRVLKKRDYSEAIISVAIYWIYRVRCCIAHNKIGEYVMIQEDEPFVAEFAEPLLREIVMQVFKR